MSTPSSTTPSASALTPATRAVRGRVLWHDMLTPDAAASHAFYSAVLGWGKEEWATEPGPYTMWTVNGAPRGGYGPFTDAMKTQGVPPHWITYFGVDDVDASVAEAVGMGARKQMIEDIPTVGRIAIMQDAQGAWFSLFTPADPAPEDDGMAPAGDASWHELWTTDAVAAYAFYTRLFGWESAGQFDDPVAGPYRMFGRNGLPLGGIATILPEMEGVPPNWLPYFRVADLDAAAARVKAEGGQVHIGPMEVPGGDRIAQCRDSLGGSFALHAPK